MAPKVNEGGLGSSVSFHSGVWGGAATTKAFLVYCKPKKCLMATILVYFVRTKMPIGTTKDDSLAYIMWEDLLIQWELGSLDSHFAGNQCIF